MLSALLATSGNTATVQALIRGALAFGLEGNAVRVTLARLKASGTVVPAGRAAYRLTAPQSVRHELASWSRRVDELVEWDGAWFAILGQHLTQRERRQIEAAGFRELRRSFFVRPSNTPRPWATLSDALSRTATPPPPLCLRLADLAPAETAAATRLWSADGLNAGYRACRQSVEDSIRSVRAVAPDRAAKTAFGRHADLVEIINEDPLLPDGFVDAAARLAFVQALKMHEDMCRGLWQVLLRADPVETI